MELILAFVAGFAIASIAAFFIFKYLFANVKTQMKAATEDLLKARQEEFAKSSSSDIKTIVDPLKDNIEAMRKAMHDSTISQSELVAAMTSNMKNLDRQFKDAKQSTDDLTRVLRHGTKAPGDMGEVILDEILQSQGLKPGIQYDVQCSITDAEGHLVKSRDGHILRPDVIIHLDRTRDVIVDSKVSIAAYFDYVNAPDEISKKAALNRHIDSIWQHVKELSAKNYASYVQPPKVKMDYVIMFVPHSGALWTALNEQPGLWRKAMDMNVYIADEQTLFAALRIIQLTWTQITIDRNNQKIVDLAEEMIDRVRQFADHFQDMGKAIDKARDEYRDACRKLAPGGRSIITTAEKLIKTSKKGEKNALPDFVAADDDQVAEE